MTGFLKSAAVATGVAAGIAAGTLPAGPAAAATAVPGTLRIGYGQACTHRAGTVAFVLENRDRHRHTVFISGGGLSPAVDAGTVPASRTVVVQFDIGAKATTVSVSVDRGAPRTQRLKGCPHGDGDQGVIADRRVPDQAPHAAPHQKQAPQGAPPRHDQTPAKPPRRKPQPTQAPRHGAERPAPSHPKTVKPKTVKPSPVRRPTRPPAVNTA